MNKDWVRIKSTHGAWYEVSNYGVVIRKKYVLVDSKGRLRGKTENRKVHKVLRSEEKHPFWDKSTNRWRIELTLEGNNKKISISMGRLIAICFVDQPDKHNAVEFIDGNVNNFRADNLKWVKSSIPEECRLKRTTYDIDYIKYYMIPKNHPLYKDYMSYIANQKQLKELIIRFMKRENLLCGLVKVGTKSKYKKLKGELVEDQEPYLLISDKDERVIRHDEEILGVAARKRDRHNFVPVRINSKVMHRWKSFINKEYKKIEIPSVHPYLTFKDMKWGIKKSFRIQGNNLYLRVESRCDFTMDDFKEIDGKEIFGE